jgi:hypothetical protein
MKPRCHEEAQSSVDVFERTQKEEKAEKKKAKIRCGTPKGE